MKAASSKEIREALQERDLANCRQLVQRLARFKKENKELLTYLLFEAHDEQNYIASICNYIDHQFSELNRRNYYWVKKGIRRILRDCQKYIRYSGKKETKIEILLHFLKNMTQLHATYRNGRVLSNLFDKQSEIVKKTISAVHPDLQYDYNLLLEELD